MPKRNEKRGDDKDSPRSNSTFSSPMASPILQDVSPECWNITRQRHNHSDGDESSSFDEQSPSLVVRKNLQFRRSFTEGRPSDSSKLVDRIPERSKLLRQHVWDDDESREDELDDSASLQQAVEDAQLQVSFAEQTAREMKEVVDWWKHDGSKDGSQSRSLKDNSLVYASAQSADEMDEDSSPFEFVMNNVFMMTLEKEQDVSYIFQSPLYSPFLSNDKNISILDETVQLEALLSPTATVGSPHREAQEQSFAVDAVCSKVQHMEDVLADLEDTSVDDDASISNTLVEPMWCSVDDLPWLDQLAVQAHCVCYKYSLQVQQWLYHALPPTLLSLWLSLQQHEPLLQCILWVLLPTLFFLLLYTTVLWRRSLATSHVSTVCLDWQVHYSHEWDFGALDEFLQEVLL